MEVVDVVLVADAGQASGRVGAGLAVRVATPTAVALSAY
jgi:hypothetical protein